MNAEVLSESSDSDKKVESKNQMMNDLLNELVPTKN